MALTCWGATLPVSHLRRHNNSLTAKSGVEPEWPHAVHHLWIHSAARLPATNPTSSCLHWLWHLGWRGLGGDGGSAGPQRQSVQSGPPRRPATVWKRGDPEGSGDQRSVRRDGSHWLWPRRSNCTKVPRWRLAAIPTYHRLQNICGKNELECKDPKPYNRCLHRRRDALRWKNGRFTLVQLSEPNVT